MSYALLADVQSEMGALKDALSATSVPSTTDVTSRILPDIAGEIDGVLSARGLVVPVTTPTSFVDFLKATNALGATARTLAELYPSSSGPDSTNLTDWLQSRYRERLDMLRRGEGIPSASTTTGALPRSYWTTNPQDADGNDTSLPWFKRATQW